jgi:hypothetical protein
MRVSLVFGFVLLWAGSAIAAQADAAKNPKESPLAIGALAGVGFPRPLSDEAMIVLHSDLGARSHLDSSSERGRQCRLPGAED